MGLPRTAVAAAAARAWHVVSEARCECCDLPVVSCGKMTEQRQRRETAARNREYAEGAFPALFGGVCAGCDERIRPGDHIRHDSVAGGYVGECCLRLWPGATRTTERALHDRGGASRLCPMCCSAERTVHLPAGGYLAPWRHDDTVPLRCCAPSCTAWPTRVRPWGRGRRGLCPVHACAYAARQHGATVPFTTVAS